MPTAQPLSRYRWTTHPRVSLSRCTDTKIPTPASISPPHRCRSFDRNSGSALCLLQPCVRRLRDAQYPLASDILRIASNYILTMPISRSSRDHPLLEIDYLVPRPQMRLFRDSRTSLVGLNRFYCLPKVLIGGSSSSPRPGSTVHGISHLTSTFPRAATGALPSIFVMETTPSLFTSSYSLFDDFRSLPSTRSRDRHVQPNTPSPREFPFQPLSSPSEQPGSLATETELSPPPNLSPRIAFSRT